MEGGRWNGKMLQWYRTSSASCNKTNRLNCWQISQWSCDVDKLHLSSYLLDLYHHFTNFRIQCRQIQIKCQRLFLKSNKNINTRTINHLHCDPDQDGKIYVEQRKVKTVCNSVKCYLSLIFRVFVVNSFHVSLLCHPLSCVGNRSRSNSSQPVMILHQKKSCVNLIQAKMHSETPEQSCPKQ